MRIFLLFSFLLFYVFESVGQELTFFYNRVIFNAPNVCDINYTNCDWRPLVSGSTNMLGYAHHPSGRLWLVLDELYDPEGYHRIKIFDTNIENCQFNLLYSIDLPLFWNCDASINVDFYGNLYLNLNEWDVANNTSIRTISRIANPSQPSIERLLIRAPDQQVSEILFYNQKIYLVEPNQSYIRVYTSDFDLIDTIIMQRHITGLTSISHGCDSVIIYAGHCGYTTSEFLNKGPDTNLHISKYDIETNILTPICNYWMGNNVQPVQLTSPLEFLSSDPECDLLIDLDRDNSTGVYPYDYLDSNNYCTTLAVPISDEDTYIHTSAPLDSIRLILSGIIEISDERLLMQPIPIGINFIMQNDSTYLITSNNPSDSLYSEALRAIFYHHTGTSHSKGTRTIIIQGFNEIKDGVIVKSYIHLEGTDEIFLYSNTCMSSQAGTFITAYLNQFGCDSLVTLTISLIPADTTIVTLKTCDPDLVGNVQNNYINQEGCDSLTIQQTSLHLLPEVTLEVTSDFNGYAISCHGQSDGSANAEVIGEGPFTYLWSTGNKDQFNIGLTAGSYEVTVEDANGCSTTAQVVLFAPDEFSINFIVSAPKCFDHKNGSIIVENNGGIEPIQYSINGLQFQSSSEFKDLSAGAYEVTAIDANGCEVKEIIWINVPLELNVELGNDQLILPGDTTILNAIVNVPYDSLAIISWSGLPNPNCPNCLIQPVAPIITTSYSISITTLNGCSEEDSLTLFIKPVTNLYIPNIFSPNGDNINDKLIIGGNVGLIVREFSIFDRWGTVVYSKKDFPIEDPNSAWDGSMKGEPLSPAVFAYRIVFALPNGESEIRYGDITLMK